MTVLAAMAALALSGAAGRNSLRFAGRFGARKLKPGRYRTAVATSASGKSNPATATFAVSR